MPDSRDTDYLKPFIESTIDAAARLRRVLIVMVTASILAFGATWNSRESGWFNSRLKETRKAERYLSLRDRSARLAGIEKTLSQQGPTTLPEQKRNELELDKDTLLRDINNLLSFDVESHIPVKTAEQVECELDGFYPSDVTEWIRQRDFNDTSQATQYAQKLDEARIANVLLVRIPLSGTVFDVDDLGLLGGFTFTIILLMFRFASWREYNNLWVTFHEARVEHREYCYRSLAMQQVLTVPPSLDGGNPPQKPSGKIVRLLYFTPLLVQFIILYTDVQTIRLGSILNDWNTSLSITLSFIFFLFILFLTDKCFQLSVLIDNQWAEWQHKSRRPSTANWDNFVSLTNQAYRTPKTLKENTHTSDD